MLAIRMDKKMRWTQDRCEIGNKTNKTSGSRVESPKELSVGKYGVESTNVTSMLVK
jgi:hypothetical protein